VGLPGANGVSVGVWCVDGGSGVGDRGSVAVAESTVSKSVGGDSGNSSVGNMSLLSSSASQGVGVEMGEFGIGHIWGISNLLWKRSNVEGSRVVIGSSLGYVMCGSIHNWSVGSVGSIAESIVLVVLGRGAGEHRGENHKGLHVESVCWFTGGRLVAKREKWLVTSTRE